MMVPRRYRRGCLLLAVCLVVVACAATTALVNQWTNPAYNGPSFKRVMVIGVSRQASLRRAFEDEFVSQLRAAGVDAVPGYRYLPEEGKVEEPRLRQALDQAGADAVIITRLVKREEKTEVTPGFYQPSLPGFYGWYATGWSGYYEPPRVSRYDVYTSETSLYDAVKNQMIWSGTAQTTAPSDINQEIKTYAALMVRALKEKKLI